MILSMSSLWFACLARSQVRKHHNRYYNHVRVFDFSLSVFHRSILVVPGLHPRILGTEKGTVRTPECVDGNNNPVLQSCAFGRSVQKDLRYADQLHLWWLFSTF